MVRRSGRRAGTGTDRGCKLSKTQNMSGIRLAEDHYIMEGTADQPVQIDCDDMQFFADHMELFEKEGRVIANGNVTYISGGNRINAERMVYYTKTRTGRSTTPPARPCCARRHSPASSARRNRTRTSGAKSCRRSVPRNTAIIHGGFTTCVQPTPRWDMAAESITLHLDDYAFLKNAVFRVKSVPLMFLPIFYYPIQEDNRATGFLMPIYGIDDAARPVAHEPVLLGHQPQPRRDDRARLVFEDRPAGRWRVSICAGPRVAGQTRSVVLEGTRCDVTNADGNKSDSRRAKLHGRRRHGAAAAAQPAGEGQRELLHQHLDPASATTRTCTRRPTAAAGSAET